MAEFKLRFPSRDGGGREKSVQDGCLHILRVYLAASISRKILRGICVVGLLSMGEGFDVEAESWTDGLDIVSVYLFEDGRFSCIVESAGSNKQS